TSKAVGGFSNILFSRSTNNGAAWSTEVNLDDPGTAQSTSFSPSIDVDPQTAGSATDDVIYVAWEDNREGSQIYAARSTDAGATFGAAVRASNQAGAAVTGITQDPNVVFVGASSVVVSYQNNAGGGIAHMYAAASIDTGATWQVSDPRLDTGVG